jgi:tricarballylate dehydrogenase
VTRPPIFAYPIRPGVTFTCLGVKVDEKARVVMTDDASRPDLFAAGMIMAPNVLGTGYLAGGGLTIGAVFGRLAGEGAARYVQT